MFTVEGHHYRVNFTGNVQTCITPYISEISFIYEVNSAPCGYKITAVIIIIILKRTLCSLKSFAEMVEVT